MATHRNRHGRGSFFIEFSAPRATWADTSKPAGYEPLFAKPAFTCCRVPLERRRDVGPTRADAGANGSVPPIVAAVPADTEPLADACGQPTEDDEPHRRRQHRAHRQSGKQRIGQRAEPWMRRIIRRGAHVGDRAPVDELDQIVRGRVRGEYFPAVALDLTLEGSPIRWYDAARHAVAAIPLAALRVHPLALRAGQSVWVPVDRESVDHALEGGVRPPVGVGR